MPTAVLAYVCPTQPETLVLGHAWELGLGRDEGTTPRPRGVTPRRLPISTDEDAVSFIVENNAAPPLLRVGKALVPRHTIAGPPGVISAPRSHVAQ